MAHSFQGQSFALLTQHGKESIIAPILKQKLGANLVHTRGFDTDLLGTFSNEIERTLSPEACALKKAEIACDLTQLSLGLGSEGSFTTGFMGFMTINSELVTCLNVSESWHVTGVSVGPSPAQASNCSSVEDVHKFLVGVPAKQHLIVQSEEHLAKGLASADEVMLALKKWQGASLYPLTISYDLRAHHCPARQERIALATENLMARLLSPCPSCQRIGFWPDFKELGLPCEECGTPSNALRARRAVCTYCHHEETYPVAQTYADPGQCPQCNP